MTFPDHLSPEAVDRLYEILIEADARCDGARARPRRPLPPNLPGDRVILIGPFSQNIDQDVFDATIHAAEQALQVVVDDSQERAWAPALIHTTRDQVIEQVIAYLYTRYHSDQRTAQAFTKRALETIQVRPRWRAFQRLLKASTTRDGASIAAQLTALKDEAGWTYQDLADQVKITKSAVIDNLKGRTVPYPDTRRTYARVFSEKLGRAIVLETTRVSRQKKTTKKRP